MAEQMSTKLCNVMLDTGSLKAAFTNMELRIYSSAGNAVPATADAAISTVTGVLICKVKNGGSAITFGTASGGTIGINSTETWNGTNTSGGSLTASFYRLVGATDDDGATGSTYPRVQGSIGVGGSDMNVGSTTIANSGTFPVTTFTQSIVPS